MQFSMDLSQPALPPMGAALPASLAFRKNLVCYTSDASTVVEYLQNLKLPYCIWDDYECVEAKERPDTGTVLVLPNVDKSLVRHQDQLAKYLQVMRQRETPFFAAIATVSPEFVPYAHMTAYLKRQFWFACHEPRPQDLVELSELELPSLRSTLRQIHVHQSIRRYVLDIVVHLRVHRFSKQASGGGCSAHALGDMLELCQTLALAQERTFVVPDLVKLAAQWYFPFHIEVIQDPRHEISLQFGSDPDLVAQVLEKLRNFSLHRSRETQYPLYFQFMVLRDVLRIVVPPI
ncbi:LAME_0G16468g1_1 [Lachancea meyersii CBS 8951]|uniref:LAME_0G16468g1_1 n=1 Tax=Lachancea meyersii CBS 8951 TaxID=1266667 RepID=A0A1G4KB28_9SACH|nr:LAME_0G16468g1_1 [Lachancea meyersii CBS 8951]